MLRTMLGCPECLADLSERNPLSWLQSLRSRWQALGFPDPAIPQGEKLLEGLEKALDSWEAVA